jgi:hypothetical protein
MPELPDPSLAWETCRQDRRALTEMLVDKIIVARSFVQRPIRLVPLCVGPPF